MSRKYRAVLTEAFTGANKNSGSASRMPLMRIGLCSHLCTVDFTWHMQPSAQLIALEPCNHLFQFVLRGR
jgi:hypothetical protein